MHGPHQKPDIRLFVEIHPNAVGRQGDHGFGALLVLENQVS
jgi:hypothetical protein